MFAPYLITDPEFYGQEEKRLEQKLLATLCAHRPSFACFRDKSTSSYALLANAFLKTCTQCSTQALLHTHVDLAVEMGAFGVHLPTAARFDAKKARDKGLYVVVSAHDAAEALEAQKAGAHAITFSPIFDSPNKGKALGLEKLKEIIAILNIDVFALGGIVTQKQVRLCQEAGAAGFASIRYFCNPD